MFLPLVDNEHQGLVLRYVEDYVSRGLPKDERDFVLYQITLYVLAPHLEPLPGRPDQPMSIVPTPEHLLDQAWNASVAFGHDYRAALPANIATLRRQWERLSGVE